MSRSDTFRVLIVDLSTGKGRFTNFGDRSVWCGGSGLATALFAKYGRPDEDAFHPDQPLIFAIGTLNGYFPLMSKTVCGFKSPYTGHFAESHGGGRSSLALRFAGLDALVFIGKAKKPCLVEVGSKRLNVMDAHFLWGADVDTTGKLVRKMSKAASGHRTMFRIGPAGEHKMHYACINIDTYRHFGRLGCGAVMGAKNLKAVIVQGDADLELPEKSKEYVSLFNKLYEDVTSTQMMQKYHNLGTPVNVMPLNELKSLPWRNMQATHDDDATKISGETFASDVLMHNSACSGCPVGCIHIGMVRKMFAEDHRFEIRKVSYDHEPNFAAGPMLGVTNPTDVLAIIDRCELEGMDIISAGVALAWATEATEKGLISEKETMTRLTFGDADAYIKAMYHLGHQENDFYRVLGQGALVAAKTYGGEEFACVLGQEMAGYGTGETYFVGQTLGFRHAHLDTGGYSYDQKHKEEDIDKTIAFYIDDEKGRVLLTSLVACLFARGVYKDELIAECFKTLGYDDMADNLDSMADHIRNARWNEKIKCGFNPHTTHIPKRFAEITTWKGPVNPDYMERLRLAYADAIVAMAKKIDP
ncbi:aldehyde ferredoxin oxidoreductase N-terminal domain-containing protein [Desulfovibrio inopinatus]|uniref:aldehyde ferredoxin oxidoreductase N-terminal domain-containing protein n=1 Tax=Desulfovibrio inopinatus TaxID=102109 RepID=UPI0003FF8948|nr:aldehyde ferredoxin oxidoreductase N-terminal domain-containing protein [Desulfovibrio inopinatus]